MNVLDRFADRLLDASIVGGFSRLGPAVRSRLGQWESFPPGCLTGRTVVVTGPTSGLGLAATHEFDRLGADLVLIGRDRERLDSVRARLVGADRAVTLVADIGDLTAVRRVASELGSTGRRIHALVHNAGALTSDRRTTPQDHEATIATHVLGPRLLTRELLALLDGGRVITVSSGGMYAAPLPRFDRGESPEMSEQRYDGTKQYAIAKRMQVTLNEIDAASHPKVVFSAMHPGWADTPGVRSSLPGFARVTAPILRTAEQGADTIVWLVATGRRYESGRFWCDRAERPIHRLPTTRRTDDDANRDALKRWVDDAISSS
ncbi:MAG: dehydrogenase [Acidimicrobiales bacterium mtb01]|nr:SDR family NAD(P)-dependent oxidoreductase [Actinomycetota bacterium]TEX45384.1 MAG: dehydrogenase [Acidimicrobiales bacterium mtb01]